MDEFIDYYEILEVHNKASIEVIEKAYKALVFKYHPDKFTEDKAKMIATEKMRFINEAKEILGNEEKRKRYDILWKENNTKPAVEETKTNIHFNAPSEKPKNPPKWRELGLSISDKYPGIIYKNNQSGEYKIDNKNKKVFWIVPEDLLSNLLEDKQAFYYDNWTTTCSRCDLEYHPNYLKCPRCSKNKIAALFNKKEIDYTENPIDLEQFYIKKK